MWPFLAKILLRLRPRKPLATSEDATNVLLWLFRCHGLSCNVKDGWIVAKSGALAARAWVHPHPSGPNYRAIQLDVEVKTRSGHLVRESFGGFGVGLHEAIGEAIKNFSTGSFHVLFAGLTDRPCSHCEVEDHVIDGVPRRLFIGPMLGRGSPPGGDLPPWEWFPEALGMILKTSFSPGLHWIRLFHAESPGDSRTSEVLVDNEDAPDLRSWLAAYPWPATDGFYSVRVFLLMTDASPASTGHRDLTP